MMTDCVEQKDRWAWPGLLAAMVAVMLVVLANASVAGDEKTPQSLLFDAPYLTQLKVPSSLNYSYRHETTADKDFGKSFEDTVAVNVGKNDKPGGLNSVMLRMFSGKRQRDLGPHTDITGNPVIMMFLERDLWEMKRRVGGQPVYYRNLIRRALRAEADIKEDVGVFNGEDLKVHTITIRPFAGETKNARLNGMLNKIYEFTVAETVPGGILKIRSVVPAEKEGGAALVSDELAFIGLE